MADENSCVVLYNTCDQAEVAVKVLQNARFDINKVSIVSKGCSREEQTVGCYNTGSGENFWGSQNDFWGEMWGMLLGAGMFWIPGLGPIVISGPLVAALVNVLEDDMTVGGLSVLGAAFYSVGIPKDSIIRYESALESNLYLMIIHGTQQEVEQAYGLLSTDDPTDVIIHL